MENHIKIGKHILKIKKDENFQKKLDILLINCSMFGYNLNLIENTHINSVYLEISSKRGLMCMVTFDYSYGFNKKIKVVQSISFLCKNQDLTIKTVNNSVDNYEEMFNIVDETIRGWEVD